MEQSFSSSSINNQTNTGSGLQEQNQKQTSVSSFNTPVPVHHKKNIYPIVRHAILIACVLLTFFLVVFLIHQNGKSIYENGI